MPEARHSMLLSDARQTSPLPANAPLLQQSVSTSNLDLRQATHQQKGQDWAKEKGNQLVQNPALVGTAVVSRPQTWFG